MPSAVPFVKLGRTGLDVSRLCLGCMTYGVPGRGNHPWTLDEDASRPIIRQALEAGLNFFDTSNSYSDGTSEEILGRALRDFARRDEVVVATKGFFPWRRGAPNAGGLSRKALFTAVDDSLRRLGLDHVDLYQIHRFDDATPIEETLEALHDIVKSGRARYVGASSMAAWQFQRMIRTSERHGWTRFVSMQDHYNLLNREEEREMLPFCAAEGIAVIPWSPLARGRLSRAWDDTSHRQQTDEYGKTLYRASEASDRAITERVGAIAAGRGVSRAQVALAWMLQKPHVTAPIIGVRTAEHLADALAAPGLGLTDGEIQALEAPYVPHPVEGYE
jgi:aryl-alcohol dehydrogenase-like predicted oxidoreductase